LEQLAGPPAPGSVYTRVMKEVTLTADEALIEEARVAAKYGNKTLDQAFQEWLLEFTRRVNRAKEYDALTEQLKGRFSVDRHYTRDEMNER
jgi:hypothetical protein